MLEKIDLSKKADKETYKQVMSEEGERLGQLQRDCKDAGIPVMIVFEGMGASGKGVQINRLIQSLDPRGFSVYASDQSNDEERMRPFLWRFWIKTPAKGRITIFDRSWYRRVQIDRFNGETPDLEMPGAYQDILSFERQLSDDGTVIIKLFLYISKEEQKKRFKKLEESKENAWRVTKQDWKRNKSYNEYLKINEEMLQNTDTEYAPWNIIEATDKDYAAMKILSAVSSRLAYELEKRKKQAADVKTTNVEITPNKFQSGVLSGIDLTKTLDKDAYKKKIDELQKKLSFLHSELYRLRIPVVLGFEGWDAGGKGGAIRRLTSHLDPRGYQV
ncbi:MAG: phosphate--AMP phosphotransferase, partial [Hungatella sp.]